MSPEDYLQHYGIPGMKWGRRKSSNKSSNRRDFKSIRKDRRRLTNAYRAEYKQRKALGKEPMIGKGLNSYYVTASTYASIKSTEALIKKYGNKKYSDFIKNERNKELIASGILATGSILGLAGTMIISAKSL